LGVREGDGGTQRGTILIWGYASTKRLRTPALTHLNHQLLLVILLVKVNKSYFLRKNCHVTGGWMVVEK
jgi:hypothetical protein